MKMANKGIEDNDLGLLDIRKEMKALGRLAVKAGIIEGTVDKDGASVAEYAAYNEYGVPGRIPSRAFMRGSVDNYMSEINATQERIVKRVSEGKLDAKTAAAWLGENQLSLIQSSIRNGNWDITDPAIFIQTLLLMKKYPSLLIPYNIRN
jgi:hypothetical protein